MLVHLTKLYFYLCHGFIPRFVLDTPIYPKSTISAWLLTCYSIEKTYHVIQYNLYCNIYHCTIHAVLYNTTKYHAYTIFILKILFNSNIPSQTRQQFMSRPQSKSVPRRSLDI